MTISSTIAKEGSEPISGYVLRKRLGAGGYGEVWLADAPGGLQKAIKLIFGTVTDSQADSELRSLERVRDVHHPFLLSLERIEVVDGQAVIVTELAESSLLDKFHHYRQRGLQGIPRSALLDYLRDTADALDFLAEKHSLQHLDVKPGNLLLIADRIKVADFGLVKSLRDPSQSLVGGLTPAYSAPEIFDGMPDFRSDQYSLAIVYMEMLTGHLPFRGTTTAELARQHLGQQPDLTPLPPADCPVVQRALSKNPIDRYSSCRQFIEQLMKVRSTSLPAPSTSSWAQPTKTNSEARTSSSFSVVTAATLATRHEFEPRQEIPPAAANWAPPRCMYIGLGGTGNLALAKLRQLMEFDSGSSLQPNDHRWCALDTNGEALNDLMLEDSNIGLPPNCTVQIPLYRPAEYRNSPPDLFRPLSRRWLYNIPRELKTEGVRPLATLAFLDHYELVRDRIRMDLRELMEQQPEMDNKASPMQITLLASLHGGTGSGLLCEIGLMIRRIAAEIGLSNYRISALASAATIISNPSHLGAGAALATLSEMFYWMDDNQSTLPIFCGEHQLGPSCVKPFDWVCLTDGGVHGIPEDHEQTTDGLAKIAWLETQSLVGLTMSEKRLQERYSGHDWLRSVRVATVENKCSTNLQHLSHWCFTQCLSSLTSYMHTKKGIDSRGRAIPCSENLSATCSGDLPLTQKACEEFARRLLDDLGMIFPANTLGEIASAERGEEILAAWARRLSGQEELIRKQLLEDFQVWHCAIHKTVAGRMYNWKQIEKLQMEVIEGFVDFTERHLPRLAEVFSPMSNHFGSKQEIIQNARAYMQQLVSMYMNLLRHFQAGGKAIARQLQAWQDSLDAEHRSHSSESDIDLETVPDNIRMLIRRAHAVLESKLHKMALHVVESAFVYPRKMKAPFPSDGEILEHSLKFYLDLAGDVVGRLAEQFDVSEEELAGDHISEAFGRVYGETVSPKDLASFAPALNESGGMVYRIVCAPVQQVPAIGKRLKKQKLADKTTLLACSNSGDVHVLCEGHQLRLPLIIGSLWRPNAKTYQIAEKLRTRIDVDWPSIDQLLSLPMDLEDPLASPPLDASDTGQVGNTQAIAE